MIFFTICKKDNQYVYKFLSLKIKGQMYNKMKKYNSILSGEFLLSFCKSIVNISIDYRINNNLFYNQ